MLWNTLPSVGGIVIVVIFSESTVVGCNVVWKRVESGIVEVGGIVSDVVAANFRKISISTKFFLLGF